MSFDNVKSEIKNNRKTWLVTGAAGFIGSHLAENLLLLDQRVVAIDNFSAGSKQNLNAIEKSVGADRYTHNFSFIEGDICDFASCRKVCEDVDYVLHQAALGSVPQSFATPLETHDANVTGTLNLMWASVESRVKRFVYASSSAVYGDHPGLPNKEQQTGRQLSPYALGKYICELYARNLFDCYQLETIGLRYFNIYGPRQCLHAPYAAVIPSFAIDMLNKKPVQIYGDGATSRDFCFVDDVVKANFLSAVTDSEECFGQVFNVSCGEQTSILELYQLINNHFKDKHPQIEMFQPVHRNARPGEIKHSFADLSLIAAKLGYRPSHPISEGLPITLEWYEKNFNSDRKQGV
jgi:UDP-N-acetylglucosamine 4-epimerase